MGDRSIQEVCGEALKYLESIDPYGAVHPIDIVGYFYEILDIEHEREDDMR